MALVKEDLGVKICKTTMEGKDYMRGETVIKNHSLLEFVEFLKQWNRRKEWDPLLEEQHLVKQLGEHSFLLHLVFQAPWPVTQRDIVVVGSRKEYLDESDTVIIAAASVVDDAVPVNPSRVRAETISGYIVRPLTKRDEPGIHIICIIWADFKGWLPGWVSSMVGIEAPLVIGRIPQIMDADKKKREEDKVTNE